MLRFSIHDLLWLMAFAALDMGWHSDDRVIEAREKIALARKRAAEAAVM